MRALALLLVVGCGGGGKSEDKPAPVSGQMWKFHVTADEDVLAMAATADRLFVGEIRAAHHQYVDSAVRIFAGEREESPFVFHELMGTFALARDGQDVLLAWRDVGKLGFAILSMERTGWTIDSDRYGTVSAVGAGGGWVVCTDKACARVDRDHGVGAWHAIENVPHETWILVPHESGPYLIATKVQLGCADDTRGTECVGSEIVKLDRDGAPVARAHVDAEISHAVTVHGELIVHLMKHGPSGGYRRVRGTDFSLVPIDELRSASGDITSAGGGLLVVTHHELLRWTDGKVITLDDNLFRHLPSGDEQDLAFRTQPDGLVHGWKWANRTHDGEQDVVVWRPL
jgi:hypothetical protein